ncbi:hypothetical protein D5S17_32710 [Pseudonocardiaceae bacterium YIM PH 21723]|nr:hypothetical protein D5S17_32710 [Pseudonocardiaceae bacterium YIM PH 21723]
MRSTNVNDFIDTVTVLGLGMGLAFVLRILGAYVNPWSYGQRAGDCPPTSQVGYLHQAALDEQAELEADTAVMHIDLNTLPLPRVTEQIAVPQPAAEPKHALASVTVIGQRQTTYLDKNTARFSVDAIRERALASAA